MKILKATVEITEVKATITNITCPKCNEKYNITSQRPKVLRIECRTCHKPIDIIWPERTGQ